MIRLYMIAVDSLNPLRPTFAALPSDNMIAGHEIIDEADMPSPERLAELAAECIEIAKTGQALPREPEPPPTVSTERPGELAIDDDEALSYEDRFGFEG